MMIIMAPPTLAPLQIITCLRIRMVLLSLQSSCVSVCVTDPAPQLEINWASEWPVCLRSLSCQFQVMLRHHLKPIAVVLSMELIDMRLLR